MKTHIGNLIFTIFLAATLTLPNFIANHFWEGFYHYKNPRQILIALIVAALISYLPTKAKKGLSLFLITLTAVEIGYYAYFHTYLPSYQIGLLFSEYSDIVDSIQTILHTILLLTLFAFIFSLLLVYLVNRLRMQTHPKVLWAVGALFLLLPLLIYRSPVKFMPKDTNLAYLNMLYSLDAALVSTLRRHRPQYQPYNVIQTGRSVPVVIVIMGESLNYKRMHLYRCCDFNNTACLETLQNDPAFHFKKAISSGVQTVVSLLSFFKVIREHNNFDLLTTQKTNLLHLAKANGYTTYWISMQEDNKIESASLLPGVDVVKLRHDFSRQYDDALLEEVQKIDFSKKTFLVIHLRANHSPYEKYTPPAFQQYSTIPKYADKDQRVVHYMESVCYVDNLLSQFIGFFKTHLKDFSLYITSDHAEMLGYPEEKGMYGHSRLIMEAATVPFIYYSPSRPRPLNAPLYNHYLISKMVAEDLGYQIQNPNENGTYYLFGTSRTNAYISYRLQPFEVIRKVVF